MTASSRHPKPFTTTDVVVGWSIITRTLRAGPICGGPHGLRHPEEDRHALPAAAGRERLVGSLPIAAADVLPVVHRPKRRPPARRRGRSASARPPPDIAARRRNLVAGLHTGRTGRRCGRRTAARSGLFAAWRSWKSRRCHCRPRLRSPRPGQAAACERRTWVFGVPSGRSSVTLPLRPVPPCCVDIARRHVVHRQAQRPPDLPT